ncbi:hypothetical protein TKK_0019133 [Trichogramma kaykai]|uniref:MADF domain-containing protein n=1 Tax=Trichogramma kaykai TaxID=54128 RepID=A0ABD2VU67_9HYME
MNNEQILNIIVGLLTDSDQYSYIYIKSKTDHGYKTSSFCRAVQLAASDLHDIDITAQDIMKIWKSARDKFVRLNKKLGIYRSLGPYDQDFYKTFIFLEDHITHKDVVKVTKWQNIFPNEDGLTPEERAELKEALGEDEYNLLWPEPDCDDNESEDDFMEQFPDVSSLLQATDADGNIEMLDEDRDLVMSTIKNIELKGNLEKKLFKKKKVDTEQIDMELASAICQLFNELIGNQPGLENQSEAFTFIMEKIEEFWLDAWF